jgi:hypothetical protein
MITVIINKIIDLVLNFVFNVLIKFPRIFSPLSLTPKKIESSCVKNEWSEILCLKIKNRLDSDLYGVKIIGMSETNFDVKIISDNSSYIKLLEHSDLNPNFLSIHGRKGGKYLWIFSINKVDPKQELILNIKINNNSEVRMSVKNWSRSKQTIKEREDGAVSIPFTDPKI